MSVAVASQKMTIEEFFALPDDGIERDLVNGVVKIRGDGMPTRNRKHSRTTAKLSFLFAKWIERQPKPTGEVLDGDLGVRFPSQPDTVYGVDVAYLSPSLSEATDEDAVFIEGSPLLTVEVLSPADKNGDIYTKAVAFLTGGVRQVWLAEPDFKTVTIYRPNVQPRFYTIEDSIDCSPEMPGLTIAVADIFRK